MTGTVALLQQYAEERIAANAAGWDANARHHQVMKAVLMNSADKVAVGQGGLNNPIGMRRTIQKTDGTTWLLSDARDDDNNPNGMSRPLDYEMGVGQLNAARALTQFKSGKTGVPAQGGTAPAIGWDYGTMTGLGDVKKYPISLTTNYVAITLVWDRWVGLTETPGPGHKPNFYEPAWDSFTPGGMPPDTELTNLDLFLMRAGETDTNKALWKSNSTLYNVEHMFYKLPAAGNYEIWVRQTGASTHLTDYALAWWGQGGPAVGGVRINQGADQRSRLTSLDVTFDAPVGFAGAVGNAFTLTRIGDGAAVNFTATASVVGGVTVVTLSGFTGAATEFGSLADGRYTLTAVANQITYNGRQLDGNGDGTDGDDYVLADGGLAGGLFRLYGDANGDRTVDNADFFLFKQTFLRPAGDPMYLDYFDYDGNDTIDNADFFQFKLRFGTSI